MTHKTILLVGATGATGKAIVEELVRSPQFKVIALIRKESLEKPRAQALKAQGVKLRVGNITDSRTHLVSVLTRVNIVISAVPPPETLSQCNLADAARIAGVERFVPADFSTLCPVGNVLKFRDEKEVVHQYIKKLHLPYTIIDVGMWYQATFPQLPSGRVEYAMIDRNTTVFSGGDTKTALIDRKDVGKYTVRIVADERTLNKQVFCFGQVITQNEILETMERVSGEEIPVDHVDSSMHSAKLAEACQRYHSEPGTLEYFFEWIGYQYNDNCWVRGDNVPGYAWYLGYLDARQLYPDFIPRSFEEFAKALVAGNENSPYEGSFI